MFKFVFGLFLICYGFYKTLGTDPVWGIFLFAALTHIRLNQLGENIPLPMQVPMAIACLVLLLYLGSTKYPDKFRRWPIEVWLFGLMVLGMVVSSFRAHYNPELSWRFTLDYAKYWLFFFLFVQMVNTKEKIEWFNRVLILSAAWLVYRCWDLRGTTGPRFENVGGDVISDANHYAAALVLLFPFVFYKVMSKNKIVEVGAGLLCFGMVMSIFISGSRGGLLGIIASFFLLYINFKPIRKKIIISLIFIAVISISFMNEYQVDRFAKLFTESTQEETRDESAQTRVEAWGLSYELFKENWLHGVGIGNFRYYNAFMREGKHEGEPGHVAHSLWFEVLSEGGVLVSVPLFLLFTRFFIKTKKMLKFSYENKLNDLFGHIVSIRVSLGGFLVCATFLNRLVYEPMYWLVAMGICLEYVLNESKNYKSQLKPSVCTK